MKTITINKIHFRPYIQWAVIAYFILGIFTGLFEAIFIYLRTGVGLESYLLWYGIGIPMVSVAAGIFAGSAFVFIYNSFSKSINGYRFEVQIEENDEMGPPPPPLDLRPENSR